jgi:HPr kinase/phosphorylase
MTRGVAPFVHATALVIGEAGVLIQGASGSGKSALALACIDAAHAAGRFAALIGDDRVQVAARHGRLVACGHPEIAGKIERRGLAIEPAALCSPAVLRLAITLVSDAAEAAKLPRLPWVEAILAEIGDVSLAFLQIDARQDRSGQVSLVFAALAAAAL